MHSSRMHNVEHSLRMWLFITLYGCGCYVCSLCDHNNNKWLNIRTSQSKQYACHAHNYYSNCSFHSWRTLRGERGREEGSVGERRKGWEERGEGSEGERASETEGGEAAFASLIYSTPWQPTLYTCSFCLR